MRKYVLPILALGAALSATVAAAADVPAGAAVAGVWRVHDMTFAYMGFTSRYSCDGLAARLATLLTLAGARPGFRAVPGCARPPGGVDTMATARLHFEALVPADGAPARPDEARIAGSWRTVQWGATGQPGLDPGDCELIVQFVREVLPAFAPRRVEDRSRCLPHQATVAPVAVHFEVLTPVAAPSTPTDQ